MTESESVALPLGDAPIFSTPCIITEFIAFVNRYLQKKHFYSNIFISLVFYLYKLLLLWYNTSAIIYPPLAQLDRVSDSDSEGHRFESCRAGQKIQVLRLGFFILSIEHKSRFSGYIFRIDRKNLFKIIQISCRALENFYKFFSNLFS